MTLLPSMKDTLHIRCSCFAAFLCLCSAAPASAAATFIPLGDLPFGDISSADAAVSSDATVASGTSWSEFGFEAFRWTNGVMTGLGELAGGDFNSKASAVSANGSVIVGESQSGPSPNETRTEAFRWTSGGIVGLGDLTGGEFNSSANGVSADGSVVVGAGTSAPGRQEAFRWTSAGGMVGLGFLPTGGDSSTAWDVSADGSIVVGENQSAGASQAFRWMSGGGMTTVGDLVGGATGSSAKAISASGSVIVGWSFSENGREAFRWTSAGGMVGLGDIPGGGFESMAEAVSADGSVIVGAGFADSGLEAFIWDASGMRNLRTVLVNDYGLPVTGWRLTSARGISADGLTIVGDGVNPESNLEAWMVRLPAQNDIVIPANSTRVFTNIRANSLTLVGENSLAVVVDNGGDDATSAIGTLSIGPVSKLDLNDNDLVIRSTAAEKNAEHSAIQAKIVSAQNGFDENFITRWDGSGISSSAARDVNLLAHFDLVGLGVIRNSDLEIATGVPGSTYTNFSGQSMTPDDILNLGWATGDINFDGVINFDDYAVVDRAFFFGGIPLSLGNVAAVPEPTAWLTAVIALIALPMFLRRLRREAVRHKQNVLATLNQAMVCAA